MIVKIELPNDDDNTTGDSRDGEHNSDEYQGDYQAFFLDIFPSR